jgi:hypothetical protein
LKKVIDQIVLLAGTAAFFQNIETKDRSLLKRLAAIKINHKNSQNRKIGAFSEPKINQKVKNFKIEKRSII